MKQSQVDSNDVRFYALRWLNMVSLPSSSNSLINRYYPLARSLETTVKNGAQLFLNTL